MSESEKQAQSGGIPSTQNRVTIPRLQKMKKSLTWDGKKWTRGDGEVFAALSIYDANEARIFDEAGGDLIVIGDSVAMAMKGRSSTIPTTLNEMIDVAKAVCAGTKRLFLVGDMPFLSYEVSNELAGLNAGRYFQESYSGDRVINAVKMEIFRQSHVDRVAAVADIGPVIAHIGLNPNKAEMLGGYRTLGKDIGSVKHLIWLAKKAEEAGAFMILIESVTEPVSQLINEVVGIQVLGIAAGRKLGGQLLISQDLLDKYKWPGSAKPKHFKKYRAPKKGMTGGDFTLDAFRWYVQAVKNERFPGRENTHFLPENIPSENRKEIGDYLEAQRLMKRAQILLGE